MRYVTKYGPWVAAILVVILLAYGIVTVRNYRPPTELTMATFEEPNDDNTLS